MPSLEPEQRLSPSSQHSRCNTPCFLHQFLPLFLCLNLCFVTGSQLRGVRRLKVVWKPMGRRGEAAARGLPLFRRGRSGRQLLRPAALPAWSVQGPHLRGGRRPGRRVEIHTSTQCFRWINYFLDER